MKVRDIEIDKIDGIDELIDQFYNSGGFMAKALAEGARIFEDMVKEKHYIFLSFPACVVATGTRGVIKELVKRKIVNAIMTTCGTLDHDIARSIAYYEHGTFDADDIKLHEQGINRLGNIFIKNENYGVAIENFMNKIVDGMEGSYGSREIAWEIGKKLGKDSILHWAWRNGIPVYVPGITDGAVGWQIWMHSQEGKIKIDVLKDEKELSDIFFEKEKISGIILGGGISKHHLIWWAQFHGGLDKAVYITTAQEWDGSLSGARLKEAISWGKVKENAEHVTIQGDATILFPILSHYILKRIR